MLRILRHSSLLLGVILLIAAELVPAQAPARVTAGPDMVPAMPMHHCHFLLGPAPNSPEWLPASSSHAAQHVALNSMQWTISDLTYFYGMVGIFVMPGETIDMKISHESALEFRPETGHQSLQRLGQNEWKWTAPETPGHSELVFVSSDGHWKATLNAFIKVPIGQMNNGRIGTFRVDAYPPEAEIIRREHYQQPDGFVEVNEHTAGLHVAPHFKLGEFISKQIGGYPKYVYLREPLLLKLETIRQALIKAGHPVSNLHVMSGFRTPYYNRLIGNVPFSRHVFGDAADIYVDNDGNGRLDDLNNDGRVDMADARVMRNVVEGLRTEESYLPLIGGLGTYGPAPHRGPFIHVDTRGHLARWSNP